MSNPNRFYKPKTNRRPPAHPRRPRPLPGRQPADALPASRLLGKYPPNLTPAQRHWLYRYEITTTFEPLHLDQLRTGSMNFAYVAQTNIRWFEAWSRDAINTITRDIPPNAEDLP